MNPTTNTEAGAVADVAAIAHPELLAEARHWLAELDATGCLELFDNDRRYIYAIVAHLTSQGATAGVVGGKEVAGG